MNEILKILEGIDKTEAESVNGWWETSIGAQFGAEKLNDIIFCFGELKAQRDELLMFAEQAYGIFNDYEIHHINKGDETKAARNRCYKEMALRVIAKAKGE